MSTKARPVLIAGIAAIGAISAATAGVVSASPSKAPGVHYGFSANAYGSRLQATPAASSGRSALAVLGCTTRTGVSRANTTEHAQQSSVGHIGSVSSTTGTKSSSGRSPGSVSSSTVNGFNLFGGALQATAVKATSTVSDVASQDNGTTTFTDLRIDGHRVASTPKPNQTYKLKGIGTLVLNAQRPSETPGTSSLTVNGLDVTMAAHNVAKLPAKSHLVLAHATSAVHPIGYVPLHGTGYGSAVLNNNTVASGHSYSQILGCAGTDGKTLRNSGAGVKRKAVLSTGSIVSTANGSNTATSDLGTTGSTVHKVRLLGGLVTANAIVAKAHVVDNAGKVTTSEQGSHFVGLKVAGKQIPANVKPNTQISLGALGTLVLNQVTRTGHGITVHMIDLHLKKATRGLAQGSDIVVANAVSGVRR